MINVPSLQNNLIIVHGKALDLDKTRSQMVAEKLGRKQVGVKGRETADSDPVRAILAAQTALLFGL